MLSLLVFSFFVPIFVAGQETAAPPTTPTYSWQETTFDYSLFREWPGESNIINHSDVLSYVFNTSAYSYNQSEQTFTREVRTHSCDGSYSYFSNTTTKGYIDVDMSLDVFLVNIQYGKAVDMVWVALKQGNLQMDNFLEQYEEDYSFFENYTMVTEKEFTKFNATTSEIIDIWTEISYEANVRNITVDGDPVVSNLFNSYDLEFSLPLILTTQIFTTKHKNKIAWAELFYEFIVYKDRDGDSIYSAGETSNPSNSGFSMYSSDEFCGTVRPMAWDFQVYSETINPISNVSSNYTMNALIPYDKSVSEIASTIQFTPPTESAENIISWNVKYPQFPISTSITDHDKDPSEWYSTPTNATHSQMSPGDFNYQFDYNLSESEANFDFTLSLPKISDEDFYNATQGYGLSLPRYNFFLSTFDIEETDQIELTIPSDLFTFISNGTTVAEVNMINPVKKNYILHDYPILGMDTEMESAGGSLNKLIMSASEQSSNAGNPLINLIYTLKDIVDADPTFTIADELFHVETQNYPVWNGEKIVHDPTLTIYFEDQGTEETPIDDPDPTPSTPPGIPGFDLFVVVGLISAVVVIQALTLKKRFVANKDRIKT